APSARLLLVFDQFEEALIARTSTSACLTPAVELVQRLNAEPITGVVAGLVVQAHYAPQVQAAIDAAHPPPPLERDTWQNVELFDRLAARRFLVRSGLTIGEGMLERVFADLHALDDTPLVYRPIALNMAGLILNRLAIGELQQLPTSERGRGILT